MSFTIHKSPPNASMRFDNGYTMSVTIGEGSYSNQVNELRMKYPWATWIGNSVVAQNVEIAVINSDGKFHRIKGQSDDVVGYVPIDKMIRIAYAVSLGDMDAVAMILDANDGDKKKEGV